MRITKTIEVGKFNVTISELTVKQTKELLTDIIGLTPEETPSDNDFLHRHWDLCIDGIKIEDLDTIYPSELQLIYVTFEEVNKVFFDLALKLVETSPFLGWVRAQMETFFSLKFAILSAEVTASASGTTDTDTSSPA